MGRKKSSPCTSCGVENRAQEQPGRRSPLLSQLGWGQHRKPFHGLTPPGTQPGAGPGTSAPLALAQLHIPAATALTESSSGVLRVHPTTAFHGHGTSQNQASMSEKTPLALQNCCSACALQCKTPYLS